MIDILLEKEIGNFCDEYCKSSEIANKKLHQIGDKFFDVILKEKRKEIINLKFDGKMQRMMQSILKKKSFKKENGLYKIEFLEMPQILPIPKSPLSLKSLATNKVMNMIIDNIGLTDRRVVDLFNESMRRSFRAKNSKLPSREENKKEASKIFGKPKLPFREISLLQGNFEFEQSLLKLEELYHSFSIGYFNFCSTEFASWIL